MDGDKPPNKDNQPKKKLTTPEPVGHAGPSSRNLPEIPLQPGMSSDQLRPSRTSQPPEPLEHAGRGRWNSPEIPLRPGISSDQPRPSRTSQPPRPGQPPKPAQATQPSPSWRQAQLPGSARSPRPQTPQKTKKRSRTAAEDPQQPSTSSMKMSPTKKLCVGNRPPTAAKSDSNIPQMQEASRRPEASTGDSVQKNPKRFKAATSTEKTCEPHYERSNMPSSVASTTQKKKIPVHTFKIGKSQIKRPVVTADQLRKSIQKACEPKTKTFVTADQLRKSIQKAFESKTRTFVTEDQLRKSIQKACEPKISTSTSTSTPAEVQKSKQEGLTQSKTFETSIMPTKREYELEKKDSKQFKTPKILLKKTSPERTLGSFAFPTLFRGSDSPASEAGTYEAVADVHRTMKGGYIIPMVVQERNFATVRFRQEDLDLIETMDPPIEETVDPPIEETVDPPIEETVDPPIDETVDPPIEETETLNVQPPVQITPPKTSWLSKIYELYVSKLKTQPPTTVTTPPSMPSTSKTPNQANEESMQMQEPSPSTSAKISLQSLHISEAGRQVTASGRGGNRPQLQTWTTTSAPIDVKPSQSISNVSTLPSEITPFTPSIPTDLLPTEYTECSSYPTEFAVTEDSQDTLAGFDTEEELPFDPVPVFIPPKKKKATKKKGCKDPDSDEAKQKKRRDDPDPAPAKKKKC